MKPPSKVGNSSIDPKHTHPKRVGYKSVFHTSFIRLLSFPFTAAATILTMSLTISYAGPTTYATIAIISTLSLLFPYADLGIGSGIINVIATTEPGDKRRVHAIASAFRVLIVSGITILGLSAFLSGIFSWQEVLGIKDSGIADIQLSIFLVLCLLAISVPLGIGQRILMGLMRNPTSIIIGTIAPLVGFIGTAIIVYNKLPFVLLVFPAAIGAVFAAAIATYIGLRAISFKPKTIIQYNLYGKSGLVRSGLWFMLLSISSALTLQFGRVLLSSRAGLEEVAAFSLSMQIYSPIWSLFVAAGTALWPIFTRNRVNSMKGQTRSISVMLMFFGCAGAISFLGLVFLGPWAASILSQGEIPASQFLFASAGALLLVQSAQLVLGAFLTSSSDFRFQALWGIVAAGFTIINTWVFAPSIGAPAPFVFASLGIFIFSVIPCSIRAFQVAHRSDLQAINMG